MPNRRLPLQTKIMILSFSIVVFSLLISGVMALGHFVNKTETEYGKRALMTARTIAKLPEVKQKIEQPNEWDQLNIIVERLRVVHNSDYIVVMNMNHQRLTHPLSDKIGTISNGEDEKAAFAEHTYLSKAEGELGVAVRAFVPVMNDKHDQIGVVLVGNVLPKMTTIMLQESEKISLTAFISLLFGILGSYILSRHVKQETFNLEPHDIVRMYTERTAAFHAMNEGIIAIDTDETITIFNEKAKHLLNLTGDLVGKNIWEVIPDTRLPEIITADHGIYNQPLQIGKNNIMSSRFPIKVHGEMVGAVAIFQDRTELTQLAEELTGVKAFVDALRVQNHEHMNKLHTIAGLLQLGKTDQALDYLFHISEEKEELTRFLNENIFDDRLSGLLLSKVSRGKELDIEVTIDRYSHLNTFPPSLDHHDFVLILGNLIENAFDALEKVQRKKKEIYISIVQDSSYLDILVEDNGDGIDDDIKDDIFKKGYSTKTTSTRGMGLYLVNQIIEKANGTIKVESEKGKGTSFIITFSMDETEEGTYDEA